MRSLPSAQNEGTVLLPYSCQVLTRSQCSGERPKCSECISRDTFCNYAETETRQIRRKYEELRERWNTLEEVFDLFNTMSETDSIEVLRRIRAGGDVQSVLSQVKVGKVLVGLSSVSDKRPVCACCLQHGVDRERLADKGNIHGLALKRKYSSVEQENVQLREGSPSDEGSKSISGIEAVDISGSVNSNDGPDLLDEDLLRSSRSRATGFVGRNSEVQWLRNLKTQIGSATSVGTPYGLPYRLQGSNKETATRRGDALHTRREPSKQGSVLHVSDSSFYLDGDDLDVDIMVDPYQLPPPKTAEKLFDCYIQTVHSSFPIVPDVFDGQFRNYINAVKTKRPYPVPEHWQATLNLVLAIGAQYSHLIQAEWQTDEQDHLIYMIRAIRILGLDKLGTSLHAPSLPLIQVCCWVDGIFVGMF